MIRRPPRSTLSSSSAASDVYKRQGLDGTVVRVTPDRARCRACRVSHVLLPAGWLPRRGYDVEIVGAATRPAVGRGTPCRPGPGPVPGPVRGHPDHGAVQAADAPGQGPGPDPQPPAAVRLGACLLYTSDAADEEDR